MHRCVSGFRADGVCCESARGSGAVDCVACSIAAGSTQNGRCETAAIGTARRPSVDGVGAAMSFNQVVVSLNAAGEYYLTGPERYRPISILLGASAGWAF